MNVNTQKGRAFKSGEEVTDPEVWEVLTRLAQSIGGRSAAEFMALSPPGEPVIDLEPSDQGNGKDRGNGKDDAADDDLDFSLPS